MFVYYPHAFLKKRQGYCNRLRPSVKLSPPKPLDEIQPNLVCELLSWIGCATALFFFGPVPWGPGEGPKGLNIIKIQLQSQFQNFYPPTKSEGYSFGVVRPCVRPTIPSVRTFCLSETISQYLLVRFNSFLVQMISTMDSWYPISLVKIDPLTLELLPLFKYR